MDYKIEDNIPIPPIQRKPKENALYNALDSLKVGQSFIIPVPDGSTEVHKIRNRLNYMKQHIPISITTREVELGIRVWRTQ
tara:strand:+ start:69 stop:311 length:243 start_codon:yes stop_codon:yes gene_type:complete